MRLPILRLAAALLAAALPAAAVAADMNKVLRYPFEIAETSFDPHKISDLYSNIVNGSMFDAPLRYDYLARPLKLVPNILTEMPHVSEDGLTYTLKIKPGIYFADDPAFNGKKRELVAEDMVFSFKRLLDPKVVASQLGEVEGYILGSDEALAKARKNNRLDYDEPMETKLGKLRRLAGA